jgi:hypothetical protein
MAAVPAAAAVDVKRNNYSVAFLDLLHSVAGLLDNSCKLVAEHLPGLHAFYIAMVKVQV